MSENLVATLQPKIDAAFRVASQKAIARARAAGHGIVTWRDGRVVEISCDEAEALLGASVGAQAQPSVIEPRTCLEGHNNGADPVS